MFEIPNDKDNSAYSVMDWNEITISSSIQYKLRELYKKTGNSLYDDDGLADIFNRKVIACTKKFGNIGDEVEIIFEKPIYKWHFHGTIFAIIGDTKDENDEPPRPPCDEWGHLYTKINGFYTQRSVVEFIVNLSKINNIKNKFPFFKNNPVKKIQQTGQNFYTKLLNNDF